MPNSPWIAWKPPLKPATTRRITSGARGMTPGPASPEALTGSTVPACMWSAIWRGSQSVTYTRVCGRALSARMNDVTNAGGAPGVRGDERVAVERDPLALARRAAG